MRGTERRMRSGLGYVSNAVRRRAERSVDDGQVVNRRQCCVLAAAVVVVGYIWRIR
jgi:hypothetical protein